MHKNALSLTAQPKTKPNVHQQCNRQVNTDTVMSQNNPHHQRVQWNEPHPLKMCSEETQHRNHTIQLPLHRLQNQDKSVWCFWPGGGGCNCLDTLCISL